jgi:uncharacterized protein YegP (UPF0339 family)
MSNRTRQISSFAVVAALGLGYACLSLTRPAMAADEKSSAGTFEVYKDKGGDFRWRLVSLNKQVIATCGQGYGDKRDCMNGIESVKKLAADAKVEEVEQP